jgi:hypothetical protein
MRYSKNLLTGFTLTRHPRHIKAGRVSLLSLSRPVRGGRSETSGLGRDLLCFGESLDIWVEGLKMRAGFGHTNAHSPRSEFIDWPGAYAAKLQTPGQSLLYVISFPAYLKYIRHSLR